MEIGQTLKLDKKSFLRIIEAAKKEMQVIGPTLGADGEVEFRAINSTRDLFFDYVNELDPPKRFLIPHTEDLFKYHLNGKLEMESLEAAPPQLLFGIRACDVKGFLHSDAFFSGAFQDNYYFNRRKNTTIVSIVCNRPLETCFCICTDSGPYLERGFDLQLTDLGADYLIEVGSEKGLELLKRSTTKPALATENDLTLMRNLRQKCDALFQTTAYMAKGIIQITNNRVTEEFWDKLGTECFSCGGCTHLCPMCTCFDVAERCVDAQTGIRFRCWDSCQYAGFTREASGHNPRKATKERIKRRFYHKLSYYYIQQDGHHGCVGCGRCIIACLAIQQLDVPAVLKRLRREGQPVVNKAAAPSK